MIAILFLCLATATGLSLVHMLASDLEVYEKIAAGWLLGLLLSTWSTFILVGMVGYTLGISLCLIAMGLYLYTFFPKKLNWKVDKSVLIFVLFWLTVISILFSRSTLMPTTNGWYTLEYSYGDMALHSTYSNYFAQQKIFSLQSPIFSQQTIQYPFLINFHSALLIKTGVTLYQAFLITSIATTFSLLVLFYYFTYHITKKRITPVIASLLFFLNGGMAGWGSVTKWGTTLQSFSQFIFNLPKDYTNIPEQHIFWTNVISTHILPQRGFLIGLSILILFLRIWQKIWYQKNMSSRSLLLISTLISLTPLFHVHTFLVLLPLCIWLFSWSVYYKKITLKTACICLVYIGILSVPQVLYLTHGSSSSFLRLQIGWKMADLNWLTFWWKNMGLHFILMLATPLIFKKLFFKKSFEVLLIIPFVSIFLICNLFIFQPYDWDNMKFFLLGYFYTACISGVLLSAFWKQTIQKINVSIVILICCFSGLLSILYVNKTQWQIASSEDIEVAKKIQLITPPNAVFLIADIHNHPVTMIAGRPVVKGYSGWLWSHGIEYQQTEIDSAEIFAGSSKAKELLQSYNISYVYIGPQERKQYAINDAFFNQNYQSAQLENNVVLYHTSER